MKRVKCVFDTQRMCTHSARRYFRKNCKAQLFLWFPQVILRKSFAVVLAASYHRWKAAAKMAAVDDWWMHLCIWVCKSCYHVSKPVFIISVAIRRKLHPSFFQVFSTTPKVRIHPHHTQKHLARLVQSTIYNHENDPLRATCCVLNLFTSDELIVSVTKRCGGPMNPSKVVVGCTVGEGVEGKGHQPCRGNCFRRGGVTHNCRTAYLCW